MEYALRAFSKKICCRIRQYVPPPDILVPSLRKLFNSYADVVCSIDPLQGKFFSDAARCQADLIIKVAQMGLLSDPPGEKLYFKCGVDRDGLTVYRTTWETSTIEGGVHTSLRRTFGSLQASPELTDSLLRNTRHCRNTSVSTSSWHKDLYLILNNL